MRHRPKPFCQVYFVPKLGTQAFSTVDFIVDCESSFLQVCKAKYEELQQRYSGCT